MAEYVLHFVFPQLGEFEVSRADRWGGDRHYKDPDQFVADYESGDLHPKDLKEAAADAISEALAPVRGYFEEHHDLLATFERDPR